jgi:predicted TPR repeat methyltransferase
MTSGNLTADRRFDYARMLKAEGDPAAAADLIAQALELAPRWAEGRFAQAEALAEAGDRAGAAAAYRAYLALDPADSMGAALRLALLDSATPAAMPQAYVRRLFDDYAPRFDAALVDRLSYRAPEALRAAVAEIAPGRRFARMLDLGCGTGLAGAAFRDCVSVLDGVDLSAAMVAEARRKDLYDKLAVAEMAEFLGTTSERNDLVVAADVLVYVGDLAPLLAAIARATQPDALVAFTLQRHDGPGYRLGTDHRYSHGAEYVRTAASGFAVLRLADVSVRREKDADVPGLLAILHRR